MALIQPIINLLFPPQCGLCRTIIESAGELCTTCWQQLNFISAPFCRICGHPLEYDMGEGAECAGCMASTPQFHGHRSVMHFDAVSKRLVHDLKYYDNPLMLKRFSRWMAQLSPDWMAMPDALLIPVPIHRWRLWQRKYNQSALLARIIARENGLQICYDALRRVKHRAPQVGLSRSQRLRNVLGVFAVNPARRDMLRGRPVILIDDVLTTGATLNACARALKRAGSSRVYCLTLARTVLK